MDTIRSQNRLEAILFGMVLVAASYFYHPVYFDNVSSRLFLISSVVLRGTLDIDAHKDQTLDIAFANGHYYSTKSIGTAVVGVPVYWAMRQVPPFSDQTTLTWLEHSIIRVVTTSVPFAVLAVVMWRLAMRWGAAPRTALWMVFAYCFGSIALLHASMFSGHQIAASFGFLAFAILAGLRRSRSGAGLAFAAGLLAGLAALADYTAMFIAAVLAVYAVSARTPLRSKLAFLAGGAVCAALLAGYNWKCFGSPFSVSYEHVVGEHFREGASRGLVGISAPKFGPLLQLLFSASRGLLFIMPVFMFSVFGFANMWRRKELRPETMVIAVIVLGYLVINSGFYGWHGGAAYGPRYLVPMLPFLALPMIFANLNSRWFLPAFAVSVILVTPGLIGLPDVDSEIKNPLVEVIVPCMARGYSAYNVGGWVGLEFPWSILPAIGLAVGFGWYAMQKLPALPPPPVPTWIEKLAVSALLIMIPVGLMAVRTRPPELVTQIRAESHFNLGNALSVRRRVERAIVQYQEALRVKPDYPAAHNNLGLALARAGRLVEAAQHFSRAAELEPNSPVAESNLGLALLKLGRWKEAAVHASRALELDPHDAQARSVLDAVANRHPKIPQ